MRNRQHQLPEIEEQDGDFQITPMVDIVFVILLFFMVCAWIHPVENQLPVRLPSGNANASEAPPATPIIILINHDQSVSLNKTLCGEKTDRQLPQLREKLQTILRDFGNDDPVIVIPDRDTRQERIIEVLDAIKLAGVKNIAVS